MVSDFLSQWITLRRAWVGFGVVSMFVSLFLSHGFSLVAASCTHFVAASVLNHQCVGVLCLVGLGINHTLLDISIRIWVSGQKKTKQHLVNKQI